MFTTGVAVGIIMGEKSLYGSEVALASLLLFVLQGIIYFFARVFGREKIVLPVSPDRGHRNMITLVTLVASFGIFVGVIRTQFVTPLKKYVCEDVCTLSGKIVTLPETRDGYQIFDIDPMRETDEQMMNVRVYAPLYPLFQVGEKLTLVGKVKEPEIIFSHDGKKTFDYVHYLSIKDVGSEIYYPKILTHEIGEISFGERLIIFNHTLTSIIATYVTDPAASLASGMLLGNTSMSKELVSTFRSAGLSHIIVLSGFNIAVVVGTLLFLLKPFPIIIRVFGASIFVVGFVIMVGGGASVIRATLMAGISLCALFIGRGYVARQALIVSLFIIMMYKPEVILYDVSLHLSFLATAGIIYLTEKVQKTVDTFLSSIPLFIREIFVTTLCAYVATLPYVMYTFGSLSLYAIVANLFIVPFVPLVMALTFFVIVLYPISSALSHLFGFVVTLLCNGIILLARSVEKLPFASLQVSVSFTIVMLMYVFLITFYVSKSVHKKDETHETKDGEIISEILSF